MGDKSITKVQSEHSPRGEMGQKYLASGIHVAMRLWEKEQPGKAKPPSAREYETVGYVIEGRAELHLEGQQVLLEPGDCWAVPRGAKHTYRILEAFTAVEATSPPAFVEGRDWARPVAGKGASATGPSPAGRPARLLPPGVEGRESGQPGGGQGIMPGEHVTTGSAGV
jgi:quercetin dioxygenase-like cupin family protein